ncbi:MAG: hypothetical protein ABIN24_12680, partial [Dyadobacter sp.]
QKSLTKGFNLGCLTELRTSRALAIAFAQKSLTQGFNLGCLTELRTSRALAIAFRHKRKLTQGFSLGP